MFLLGFKKYIYIILGGIILLQLMYCTYCKRVNTSTISKLVEQLDNAKRSNIIKDSNIAVLEAAVKEQNLVIDKLKLDYNTALSKYNKWKSKHKKYRYKVITKVVTKYSNECKDIKRTLDNVKHVKYEEL
jgi:hypothetical protein